MGKVFQNPWLSAPSPAQDLTLNRRGPFDTLRAGSGLSLESTGCVLTGRLHGSWILC
jgi:hypothetical protein